MKKLLPRLALLAAPFLVYFALFFAFEPYDYFGLKGGASGEDSVITRVRAYLSAPEDAIILGDSRMAHFDMDAVAAVSGRGWSNLAFGGASLNESIDLFYLAAENNPGLDACYFGVSFYTLRAGDSRNRMEAIGTVVKNPVAYMLNFDYNADMINELLLRVQGVQTGATRDAGAWEDIDFADESGGALPMRRNCTGKNCLRLGTRKRSWTVSPRMSWAQWVRTAASKPASITPSAGTGTRRLVSLPARPTYTCRASPAPRTPSR